MKIFKVIHGYPIGYNAGSEVYFQTVVVYCLRIVLKL